MSLKRELKFFENYKVTSPAIDKLIFKELGGLIYDGGANTKYKWIEQSTIDLREFGDIIKSTYIRWALAINGLNLGHEKYKSEDFKGKAFAITSARFVNGDITKVNIMAWDGPTASQNHLETVNMLASYAIIDMYALLEELILKLFKTYWFYNPESMLVGKDNRSLRILYRDRNVNPDAWENTWNERLDKWQRNKIYDGIGKTFISYYSSAKLKVPKDKEEYTVENIATTLKSISVLRNCLIHGSPTIPKELAEISNIDKVNEFPFVEGEKIELNLNHLISIEQFTNAFVATLNVSLIEKFLPNN